VCEWEAWTDLCLSANECREVIAEGDESNTTLYSISCTLAGGSGKQSAVFFEPTLPSARVSADYSTALRTVGDWTTFCQSRPILSLKKRTSWRRRTSKPLPRDLKASTKGVMTARKGKRPRLGTEPGYATLFKPIFEYLGPTPETTIAALRVACEPLLTSQYSLQDALPDRTDEMHAVTKDLSSEVKANVPRTIRLDVGERAAKSGTRSLFQLATATKDELSSVFT
jgi:hypothetical protein